MLHVIVGRIKPYMVWVAITLVIGYIEHSIFCGFESFFEVIEPIIMLGLLIGFLWDVYINDLFEAIEGYYKE